MTEVEIANLALSALDIPHQITSLSENSPHASNAAKWMRTSIMAVLDAHDWQRAKTTIDLSEAPVDAPWGTACNMPNDIVRVVKASSKWEVMNIDSGIYVVVEEFPATLTYIKEIPTSQMTEAMCEAIAMRLAYYISGPSAGRADKQAMLFMYQEALSRAMASENVERAPAYRKVIGVGKIIV